MTSIRGPPGCRRQGSLYYKQIDGAHRICVPDDANLRQLVIREAHDSPLGAHFGMDKTQWRVQQTFTWPGLAADVRAYVRSCDLCQRSKPMGGKMRGLLQPLPVPHDRWEEVSLDFIVGLPRTKDGHDAILVFVDRLSKWAYFVPTVTTVDAKETARLFHDVVFSRHGMPKRLISDRDARFTSHFWRALFDAMGTTLGMSTAYHPQTDGQTERVNRILEEALRAYVNAMQTDWDCHLPSLQFAYNTARHSSTNETPFFLNYGRHPIIPTNLTNALPNQSPLQNVPVANAFLQGLRAAMERANTALEQSRARYKRVADTHRKHVTYEMGDKVLLSMSHVTLPGGSPPSCR